MSTTYAVITTSFGTNVCSNSCGLTPAEMAAGSGVTDPACFQALDPADFDPACMDFTTAFTLVDGVVGFDLAKAKKIAAAKARAASAPRQRELLEGFTAEALAAQVAIPAASRDARVQSVITALNAETQAVLDQEAAIQSAGTIAELNAIVNPA